MAVDERIDQEINSIFRIKREGLLKMLLLEDCFSTPQHFPPPATSPYITHLMAPSVSRQCTLIALTPL